MASESSSSLDDLCQCGHPRRRHLSPPGAQCVACSGDEERSWRHDFQPADEPPLTPEEEEEASCPDHPDAPVIGGMCGGCTQYPADMLAPKPPPTSEEAAKHPENESHESCPTCWQGAEAECMCCHPSLADAPPQPERRPPYAVAYSANGHLYEVMLPGDAIVTAVDGALIIKHADFQINGIVQVLPVRTREASDS